jgi:Coenzyme PQQ synthesis protein D (PqqD)
VQIPDNVLRQEVDGELVLLDVESGLYFSLNEVGVSIWAAIEAGRNRADILRLILEEYDVDEAQASVDVDGLLAELRSRGLIRGM